MCYRHILVAVDLAADSQKILDKVTALAKPLGAKVSLIHVDEEMSHEGEFSGLIDTDIAEIEPAHPTLMERTRTLQEIAEASGYPIAGRYLIQGDLSHGLEDSITRLEVDLVVCGHHHNFWSRLAPSSRQLVNTSPVDLLIIPLPN